MSPQHSGDTDKDTPLRDDIRMLGRVLGNTVRNQEGNEVFELIEKIRQTSIRFHRDDDKPARRELELILDSMSTSQTVRIVRAFSYFSHLANIGDTRSLIIHPASTTHRQLSDAQKVQAGAGPDVVRLSIGLEDTADIIADLEQGLKSA